MGIFNFLKKSSVSEGQYLNAGQAKWSMQDWSAFAKEGYGLNPTVFSCINKIATNAAKIKPLVKVNGERAEGHPLELLLAQPNIDEGGVEFRIASYSWVQITGNCFTEKVALSGTIPTELWNWQPYKMSIAHSPKNPRMPSMYSWNKNQPNTQHWDVDPVTGASNMLHWRTFNPDPQSSFFGQAPMKAAASSGDQLNASNLWRFTTLKNDCSPSGILSTDQSIDGQERKEYQKDLNRKSGAGKNSKFMLLGGGLKWQQLGMSAKDADWLGGSKFNKQEICEVFGVPTQLLGIEGSQTYANYEEARLAFYVETVLPMVDLWFSELNRWLAPLYGENVEVFYDEESISALDILRTKSTEMKMNSGVLTTNEKRELIGYEKVDDAEADQILVNTSQMPLGLDVFNEDEQEEADLAQAMKRAGIEDPVQKAFNLIEEKRSN